MTTTIHTILEEFREAARSKRDMGDKFERLIVNYLRSDPQYIDLFSEVWLWTEWPDHNKKPDTGIDIVAKERNTDGYCAIQCKFFDPDHELMKSDIDSFFTASGKKPFTTRMIVCTTDKWSKNAEDALEDQHTPCTRLRVADLDSSPVDWSTFSLKRLQTLTLKEKKKLRKHQEEALKNVIEGLEKKDRGKLIMACGTGKTFTALKIAEKMVPAKGSVLFLVPSISLLSQSLREWTAEAEEPLHSCAVCSDTKVGKKKDENEDISLHDLAFPATTDHRQLTNQLLSFKGKRKLTVIFSTYQSIKVISEAQKHGAPDFDLIICDEAHRTTGVTLDGEEESHFVKIHDNDFIKGKKRLYMTATPRIYSDDSKSKAQENDAELCSMDDEKFYGKELHRLDFSEAVAKGLLSDYKVIVLAVNKSYVNNIFQNQFAGEDHEIQLEDHAKIIGCWNGLSKRVTGNEENNTAEIDSTPMHRAVAFTGSIKNSKKIRDDFSKIIEEYAKNEHSEEDWLKCDVHHVDGTQNALFRSGELDWLREDTSSKGNICRILTNARCLSEGVDVPALDAVMFLNPRNSVVDIVQSVGRVMRKAEGKKYGYIILPIAVPAGIEPEEALKDNQKYKIVWQVLQALRAHDDRFNAVINKLDLNHSRPDNIQIIGIGGNDGENNGKSKTKAKQGALNFHVEDWKNAIYAKIVMKCGNRRYWETWAKDVAAIAEKHIEHIQKLLDDSKPKHKEAFDEFLKGLQDNLNPSIDKNDAIEMLSQHLITKPVFDALFENYKFTQQNPVSISMQKMLDILHDHIQDIDTASLQKFYDSVKMRATGINTAEGKQKIIIELYDKFFKAAFPRMAERLGIVYTPIEVVDFIINSANEALKQEFGSGLTDEGVHILDPFTGTGTFMVRLLQSGLINKKDLIRKYREELHANEIILLAYYIAAINIEETYHSLTGGEYEPFDGIVLTDTFQLSEGKGAEVKMFPENNKRAKRQNSKDIRVIIGNPPYSVGQTSENDANKNIKYEHLDDRISKTYVENSSAGYFKSAYDSYIRSIRWASDRIGQKGIICYVSNGSFIDNNSMDGLRKCLTDEFSSIYCFNLRGKALTSGELRRKEKGNVFGEGTKTLVAISIFIKNPDKKEKCQLYYHDIGDYLDRREKLDIIRNFNNIKNIKWSKITPNSSQDWINKRDPAFDKFVTLGNKEDKFTKQIFNTYSLGVSTNRDPWVYNYSKEKIAVNTNEMIKFYNQQLKEYKSIKKKIDVEDFIDNNPKNIKWSRDLKKDFARFEQKKHDNEVIVQSMYRPFCKQWLYFDKTLNDTVGRIPSYFPNKITQNLLICVTGIGATKEFTALMTNLIPNLDLIEKSQCFPLTYFEKEVESDNQTLFNKSSNHDKKSGITDTLSEIFKNIYDNKISKEDIFYYVYGILHSTEYKERFSSDLKKMLPRIPMAEDFWAFSKAGRELAEWHLNYETVKPYKLDESNDVFNLDEKDFYKVTKMRFGKNGKEEDKSQIIYNSHITLKGIPLEAYEYVVNGRPALEWIIDRYQVTVDQDSGSKNDPNDWSEDPKYILNLVKRIVTVSLETMKIVKSLPPLNERK